MEQPTKGWAAKSGDGSANSRILGDVGNIRQAQRSKSRKKRSWKEVGRSISVLRLRQVSNAARGVEPYPTQSLIRAPEASRVQTPHIQTRLLRIKRGFTSPPLRAIGP